MKQPTEQANEMVADWVDETKSIMDVLSEIEVNHRRFERARSLRKQYHICLENERLFAKIGIHFPPIFVPRGPVGWWMRFRQPSPQRTDAA